jgi:hypothetical protein
MCDMPLMLAFHPVAYALLAPPPQLQHMCFTLHGHHVCLHHPKDPTHTWLLMLRVSICVVSSELRFTTLASLASSTRALAVAALTAVSAAV